MKTLLRGGAYDGLVREVQDGTSGVVMIAPEQWNEWKQAPHLLAEEHWSATPLRYLTYRYKGRYSVEHDCPVYELVKEGL